MTLDDAQRRDQRITSLEALGYTRTLDEQDELGRLLAARDQYWRRLPRQLARARARLHHLAALHAQAGLPFPNAERITA